MATRLELLEDRTLLSGNPGSTFDTAETEDNNSVATANAVAINSRVSGAIGVVGDQDYFAVTLTEPSRLTTRVETDSGMDVVLSLSQGAVGRPSKAVRSFSTFGRPWKADLRC